MDWLTEPAKTDKGLGTTKRAAKFSQLPRALSNSVLSYLSVVGLSYRAVVGLSYRVDQVFPFEGVCTLLSPPLRVVV